MFLRGVRLGSDSQLESEDTEEIDAVDLLGWIGVCGKISPETKLLLVVSVATDSCCGVAKVSWGGGGPSG